MRLRGPASEDRYSGEPDPPAVGGYPGHGDPGYERPDHGYPGYGVPWAGTGQGTTGPYRVRRRHRLRWLRRTLGVIIALVVLAAVSLAGLLLVIPSVRNAESIARAFDRAQHVVYPGPAVPPRFAGALVATEDHRFYSEPGFDPFAVARLVAGKLTGRGDQGGATLYQQLAKMLYTPGRSGLGVQAEQAGLGIKLDFAYSKAQILQMYSDVAYFGNGYYGLNAASCGYFSVPPAELSWPQAALLAGAVQAPSAYNPFTNYPAARAREGHVLSRLAATGRLSPGQAQAAFGKPLRLTRNGHCTAQRAG